MLTHSGSGAAEAAHLPLPGSDSGAQAFVWRSDHPTEYNLNLIDQPRLITSATNVEIANPEPDSLLLVSGTVFHRAENRLC